MSERRSLPPIIGLSPSQDRKAFDSGAPELDRYLREQASQDVRRRFAAVFVAHEAGRVVGFYSLAATGIALAELPEEVVRRLPRYPLVPATLLGRLAVDRGWQGTGLGEHLLLDALFRALRSEIPSHAVVVDTRDEQAAKCYERYGFTRFGPTTRRLFLPMATIARLAE